MMTGLFSKVVFSAGLGLGRELWFLHFGFQYSENPFRDWNLGLLFWGFAAGDELALVFLILVCSEKASSGMAWFYLFFFL